ncbi:MAG TPA: multicopper oxidase domain-containing protein [Trebonia sp.]|nr:multicopper oxidase domain-containing protein [Trebonia sp.]
MGLTRRQALQAGLVTGAGATALGGAMLAPSRGAQAAVVSASTIPQFITPLWIPPAMPITGLGPLSYSVAARPIRQQVLPPGYPATPVFAYGSARNPGTFHAPGYTIESVADRPTEVTWINHLVDEDDNFVPSLLPVDPTLHWANPPGGPDGQDVMPPFTSTPGPYTGPVPMVVHLHGGHVREESDGYPEAWFLPQAANIPSGYATAGRFYDRYRRQYADTYGSWWAPGSARAYYDNDQRATQLWYHDHALGLTRLNVRAGLHGMYIIRGGRGDLDLGQLPGPAPQPGDLPGMRYYEIPLILSDATFNADGTMYLPSVNAFGGGGPYVPTTDIPPIWNGVFFGSTITVNGNTWPYLAVEPRRYRFRVLNSSAVRPFVLKVVADPLAPRPASPALPIWVIGSDGGLLPVPVSLGSGGLQIQPSERYDIIVDFTGLPVGAQLYLINEGGASTVGTTGSVMRFMVTPLASVDLSIPPDQLAGVLPPLPDKPAATTARRVSFNDVPSSFNPSVTARYLCGTVTPSGAASPRYWDDPITERPAYGSTEIWEIYNSCPFTHVFHIHLVQFRLLGREPMAGGAGAGPASYEAGDKDSVTAPGGQITRVKATFDRRGRYVWHCHILDHEDNEMMRPWECR